MNMHENYHVEPLEKPIDQIALSAARATILAVLGKGCPRCAPRVRNGLLNLDGVLLADVLLERGMVAVAYNSEKVTVLNLEAACDS